MYFLMLCISWVFSMFPFYLVRVFFLLVRKETGGQKSLLLSFFSLFLFSLCPSLVVPVPLIPLPTFSIFLCFSPLTSSLHLFILSHPLLLSSSSLIFSSSPPPLLLLSSPSHILSSSSHILFSSPPPLLILSHPLLTLSSFCSLLNSVSLLCICAVRALHTSPLHLSLPLLYTPPLSTFTFFP